MEFCGYKNRYSYLPLRDEGFSLDGFHSFIKYDMKYEKIVNKVRLGETMLCGEICFAKR